MKAWEHNRYISTGVKTESGKDLICFEDGEARGWSGCSGTALDDHLLNLDFILWATEFRKGQ